MRHVSELNLQGWNLARLEHIWGEGLWPSTAVVVTSVTP